MAIDLRSDTVTRPSAAMREAIANAPVGDDVYSDDPTVNSLEERVAAMFGKEAGVFTPTGSLANQLAIRMLVAPGEELIAETNSHIVRAELGAAAVFSGITTRTFPAKNGLLKAADALEMALPRYLVELLHVHFRPKMVYSRLQMRLKSHVPIAVRTWFQQRLSP